MAEPDKRQHGDGSDNYTNAASNLAKAARQSGQEAAKQASAIGAEAASRGAGAAVSGGVKAGKAVAGIAKGAAAEFRNNVCIFKAGIGNDLAHKAEAIGMNTGRSNAYQYVTNLNFASIN